MAETAEKKYNCPVEATVSQIGGKYKAIILYHLLDEGVLRFSQLQRYSPRATAKMMSQQLRCGLAKEHFLIMLVAAGKKVST